MFLLVIRGVSHLDLGRVALSAAFSSLEQAARQGLARLSKARFQPIFVQSCPEVWCRNSPQ